MEILVFKPTELLKTKYTKRTGSPGSYVYEYNFRDNSGRYKPKGKYTDRIGTSPGHYVYDYNYRDVGEFTPFMLGRLKKEYAHIKTIDPAQPTYHKMTKMLDSLDQSHLKQLAEAGINFLSMLARNRLKKSLLKSKYTKRTGSPGNYKYEYGEKKGKNTPKVVYSQGAHKVYPTKDSDMFIVKGDGKIDTIYSLNGAKKLIDRYEDMKKLGFTDVGKYVAYKNVEYRKKQDVIDSAKQSVIDKQAEYYATTHTDKPLYIDMEKLRNLIPMQQGKVKQSLDKRYRSSDGNIRTLREVIESGEYISKDIREVPKYKWNRVKYNRMNAAEQAVYEKKLEETKTEYVIQSADGKYWDIPKTVYNLIDIG